jgi:acyl-coenzyme A thioesterase 9
VSRPVPVAPLIVETEEEKALFKKGEENYMAKKALRKRSLLERAPDDEESDLIHSMWTKEMSYISTSLRKSPSLLDPTNTVSQTPKFPPSAPQTKSP